MWRVEPRFRVRFGGNLFINTTNLVVFNGVPLFRLRRNDDGMLGIDFDVFDAQGKRIATFAKGIVVQGDTSRYSIESGHAAYSVTEKSSGRVIARVQRRDVEGAELDVHVQMYLPNGVLFDASPDHTNLPGASFRGGTFENLTEGAFCLADKRVSFPR